MIKEDLELLTKEFQNSSERWTDLALGRLHYTFDLNARNADREFNLFLSLTALSAAFLAIIVPLIIDRFDVFMIFATVFFLISSIVGIALLVFTIYRDKRLISEDSAWEQSIYEKYLKQSLDIENSLYEYNKEKNDNKWDDVKYKIERYFEGRKSLKSESEQRKLKKEEELSAKLLKYLKKTFWSFFVSSILMLFAWFLNIVVCIIN